MDRIRPFLVEHWFGVFLLVLAVTLGLLFVWRRQREELWYSLAFLGGCLALIGLGGLILPPSIGMWVAAAAVPILFGMILVLVVTGGWYAPLGWGAGALLFLGVGGMSVLAASEGLRDAAGIARSLEATRPWWLILLGLIPVIIWMSYRSLAGLGPIRRWVAIGLRCTLVLFLTLALAEVRMRRHNEHLTVLYLVDRSLSIPEELDAEVHPDSPQARLDRRLERVERLINESVESRGLGHERDKTGIILFGRRPRLEIPPADAPRLNFRFRDVASTIDGNYTDVGAAFKLALASFPEGTAKRIVLVSDGNENLGNAEEQARIAERNGVQVDVVTLAAGYRNENEVLVQAVEAPARTEQGSRVPIRVLVRSYNPRMVIGTLTLRQINEGLSDMVTINPGPNVLEIGPPARVRLRPGLNSFNFKQKLLDSQQSYTYDAVFQPEAVEAEGSGFVKMVGDRIQNNNASTHVVAMGQRRVLVVEPTNGDHQLLVDRLTDVGNKKYTVHAITADQLPKNKTDLGVFLSNYDCVVMANVPAELISEEQQEMLRSNTHDQGCGLVMIGGPDSFGAGGWQGTPVEKALPVDCDIKSLKIQGKGGLVLIMHASEMADGNRWQKEIAKLAIKKLSPMDEVGVIDYDFTHKWHIPLQVIGNKRNSLLALVDRMQPGDMPDFDPSLKMAHDKLSEVERELATKHCIIISDGDPQQMNKQLLASMKSKKITVTTVGVATHGAPMDQALKSISDATGGRFYKVTNPRALPSIYIKETRLVSQSFLYEKPFVPKLTYKSGPADKLSDPLRPLYGFVRTTPKPSALVEIPIQGPPSGEIDFPILAFWHYGLGKSVAFTSDARSSRDLKRLTWDRDWANSDIYARFWEQVVDWSCRSVESGRLMMSTDYRDGKVRVTVDARDSNNRPITNLMLRGAVTTPGGKTDDKKVELRFEQKNSGLYEAELKADEAGSYFINAQATQRVKIKKGDKEVEVDEGTDSVRAGVTVPYSPEFSDLESNTGLLGKIAGITGGKVFNEDDATLTNAARSGEMYREGPPHFKNLQPIWFWLVFLTGILLFFDIAVRRIAVDPLEVGAAARRVWGELRGRAQQTEQAAQYFERLRSRKEQVGQTIDQARGARRFDGTEISSTAPPPGVHEGATGDSPRPAPRPADETKIAPKKEQEADDYASRLLRAKKRVWKENQE